MLLQSELLVLSVVCYPEYYWTLVHMQVRISGNRRTVLLPASRRSQERCFFWMRTVCPGEVAGLGGTSAILLKRWWREVCKWRCLGGGEGCLMWRILILFIQPKLTKIFLDTEWMQILFDLVIFKTVCCKFKGSYCLPLACKCRLVTATDGISPWQTINLASGEW